MKVKAMLSRLLAFAMAVAICVSCLPLATFANEVDTTTNVVPTVDELKSGTYVIWNANAKKAMAPLGESASYGYAGAVDVTVTNGILSGFSNEHLFTITKGADGKFSIADSFGRTLYMKGTYNNFNVTKDPSSVTGAEWVLESAGNGQYYVKNVEKAKYLTFDSKFGSFGIYPDITEGSAITLTPASPVQEEDSDTSGDVVVPAGNTATLVTDAASLKAGDQVIIVATGSDFAMSTEQKTNNRGQAAVTKDGNVATYGEDTQVLTLEAGTVAGTLAFNTGSGYLFAASSKSNHLKTEKTLSANSSWLIDINDAGVATVKAQGTNTRNWLRHNKGSSLFACYAENSTMADISIYKLGGAEEEGPVTIADGTYVIWDVNQKKALSNVRSYEGSYYYKGVDVTENGGVLSGYQNTEIWTVTVADGKLTITSGTEKLGMSGTYGSISNPDGCTTWELEKVDADTYKVKNTETGKYISLSSNYGTWSSAKDAAGASVLKFTPAEEIPEPDKAIPDGNYVIWAPAYNMALSTVYGGFYNNGVKLSVSGEEISGYSTAEVWTVTNNDDGTLTISCSAGKFSMDTGFSSMPLNKVHDKWTVEDAGNGLFYVKNVGRDTYVEWYESKQYWSGYYKISSGSEGMFALKFTPVEKGFEVDSSVVDAIAQWGGMTVPENTDKVYGDKYFAGDEKDTQDVFTAVVGGNAVTPWVKGGREPNFLYYMGGSGIGSSSDDYLQLAVNAAGWGKMKLSFRLRASNTAPGSFKVQYSADGGKTFHSFSTGSYSYAFTAWSSDGSYPVSGEGTIKDGIAKTSLAAGNYVSFSFDVPAGADNCENLLIRLVPGTDRADKKDGTISKTSSLRMDGVKLEGSPIVDSSITGFVAVTPNGEEDQPVGTELTMESKTEGATIYYRVDGGKWQTYDAANKPVLQTLPCTIEAYASATGKADSVVLLYTYSAGTVESVKMTPNGGSVYIDGESTEIVLSSATEGATIYYKVSTDGVTFPEEYTEYTSPITINKGFKKLVVKAYAAKEGFTTSVEVERSFTERDNAEFNIFFGQLHSHTDISDGAGTVEDAFKHASEVKNLDFLAVTDHSNSFDNADSGALNVDGSTVSNEWLLGHQTADKYTTETFAGLYGYEMTWSNGLGHMNTFNSPGWQSRTQSAFTTYSSALQNYYNALTTTPESISQFNHPGTTFGDFSDFAHYTEEYDDLITLIEVGNGEGAIGSSGYFPSYEYYTRALDKGWHVAPTNNQDNHKGLWGDANTGRSVILADSLNDENIYDALRNYRVYATEDNDLNIYYTLDGNIMGSILTASDVGKTLSLSVRLSDATDSAKARVEVIVNGGLSLASENAACNGTVTFEVPADYNYYYIKITQADGDIAVTAPVWVGTVEAVGISSLTAESSLTIVGEEQTFNLEMFNNESKDLEITSLVFTNKATGEVIHTDSTITAVAKKSTASCTFGYTFAEDGIYTITATAKGTLNGFDKTYTQDLELAVMPKAVTSKVIVDGTHFNDYVTGYYGGNTGNMTTIAAEHGIKVHVETKKITAEMLEDCSLLVISAPAKKSGTANAGEYSPSRFEDDFIQLVKDYVEKGGSVIVCGLADYQDKGAPSADYHTAAQLNKLLKAIGSTMTINDDEAYDEENNGGQAYRLYPSNFNTDSKWTKGIVEGQTYSQYSGCTVDAGNGAWLVKGFDSTYSIDSDKDGVGGLEKGNAVFMAAEDTSYGGTIFAAGGVFLSDFEVKAELDNIWDLPYANRTIYENILNITRTQPEITPIAKVRESASKELGRIFVVEGYVTAGTANENTTFFDAIYLQDETGGLTVFPYSNAGLELGTKMRITGYTDAYQGDIEIQILTYQILDDEKNVIKPEKMSAADAMNYTDNGGELIQVEGEVVDVILAADGKGVTQFVVKDEKGDLAKVFIDGYILSGTTGENTLADIVKKGNVVSAVGLLYLHPEGDSTESVAVLRVRDCDEVVLVKENTENDDDKPGDDDNKPGDQVDITKLEEAIKKAESINEKKYTAKSYKNMKKALEEAKAILEDENATQEAVDKATKALNKAISELVLIISQNPQTDDQPMGVRIAVVLMVCLLAVTVIPKRRKTVTK